MCKLLATPRFSHWLCRAFPHRNHHRRAPLERGQQAYMKYMCYTCHGTLGQGADRGTGPKIAPGMLPYAAFALQTRTPRLDMPPYRQQFLSDQELADIYAYLLTIKPSPAAKDIPLLNF